MKTVKSESTLSDCSNDSGQLTEATACSDVSSLDGTNHSYNSICDEFAIEDENDSNNSDSTGSMIKWGPVHVREYERIISDSTPPVGIGIGIGWASVERPPVSIERWESDRPPRRTNLRLSSITRKNMMQHVFGYSEEELRLAERENQKIRRRSSTSSFTSKQTADGAKKATTLRKIGKTVTRASWTLLKGLGAASQQSAVMMSSAASMTHAYTY
jgi:hypothetical protein